MKPKHIFFFTALLLASFVSEAQSVLWATAMGGGAHFGGAILQADSSGNNFHVTYSFVDITGSCPLGKLVLANNGKLYGVTVYGGQNDCCVIYSYDISTNTYTDIYDYSLYPQNGTQDLTGLILASNNMLYGLTAADGANSGGVIFSIDPTTDTYQDIYDFNFIDGSVPYGGLFQASNGMLYGMTNSGGSDSVGVIFSYNIFSNTYTKLYDFNQTGGNRPRNCSFIESNGKLYGMTTFGGVDSSGVIFSFDLSNNSFNGLYDFDITNGASPYGSLMQANNGLFYGFTFYGGVSGMGVIFSYDINTNTYTKLYDFTGMDGAHPLRTLVQVSTGLLMGTTCWGGSANAGVIFSFNITNNSYSKLFDFTGFNGSHPNSDILETPILYAALPTLSSNQPFSIYPNPAINSITINGGHSPVEFVDVYGRVIKTLVTGARTITTVDITQFPDVFFVRDGEGLVKKVVRR